MAYTKTTWVDRVVQFANRFTKSNETSTSVDLVANPGTVTTAGTPLSAANLNKIETGIFDAFTQMNTAGIGTSAPAAADLNTIPINSASGFYTANSTTLNKPAAVDGSVIHIARDSRPSQIFFDHVNNDIYYRGYTSSGWQAWVSVLTSAGNQVVNGSVTGTYLNAIGTGDINLDATDGSNAAITYKLNGVTRAQLYHSTSTGKFVLQVQNPDGTTNAAINFGYLDGVTPGALMQFPTNLQYLSAGGFKAGADWNNSDQLGIGNMFFADVNGADEGMMFPKTGTAQDSTDLTGYTCFRVDGAGAGWIGSDEIYTTGNLDSRFFTPFATTTPVTASSATPTLVAESRFTPTEFRNLGGRKVYFEAVIKAPVGGSVGAALYEFTGPVIAGTQVTTGTQAYQHVRTGDISSILSANPSGAWLVGVYLAGGTGTASIVSARLIVKN